MDQSPTRKNDAPAIQVVVLICCYNGRRYLDDCLGAIHRLNEPGIDRRVVFIDNACTDGSGEYVRDHWPHVDVIRLDPNRGFTGGNNAGWDHARRSYPDARYIYLLNVDTVVGDAWLKPIVDHMESQPHVGCAQSKLMLHPQTDRFNSAGNRCHYLGFGYATAFGQIDQGQHDRIRRIDFASGAALMVRADLLRRVGLFDEKLHMYHEDTELGWKLRAIGFQTVFVPHSVVYHKYNLDSTLKNYFYLERNRWALLLTWYRKRTLLLLLPAIVLTEAALLAHAALSGHLLEKIRAMTCWLNAEHRAWLRDRRAAVHTHRTIGDRELIGDFSGRIEVPWSSNVLLRYVLNPLLAAWWRIVRPLLPRSPN